MIYHSSLLMLFPPACSSPRCPAHPPPVFLRLAFKEEGKKESRTRIDLSDRDTHTPSLNRLLWRAPLQRGRFQPQLYGEYMVVKALMKTEDAVDSGKQLPQKDGGSHLFSLPPALLPPPSDCPSLKEEHLKGPFRSAGRHSGSDARVRMRAEGMSVSGPTPK